MAELTPKQKALKKALSKFFDLRNGYERAEFRFILWKLTGKNYLWQLSDDDVAVAMRRLELKIKYT